MNKSKEKTGKNNRNKKNNKCTKKCNNGQLEKDSKRHSRNVRNNTDVEYAVQVFYFGKLFCHYVIVGILWLLNAVCI